MAGFPQITNGGVWSSCSTALATCEQLSIVSFPKTFTQELCLIDKQYHLEHARRYPNHTVLALFSSKNFCEYGLHIWTKFDITFLCGTVFVCVGEDVSLQNLEPRQNSCHPQKLDWYNYKPSLKLQATCFSQAPLPRDESYDFIKNAGVANFPQLKVSSSMLLH